MPDLGWDPMAPTRNHPTLLPKHKVFLSHSSGQKAFVHQLCLELERWDRFSFYDRRRDDLPTGESFSPLICEAIQQCQVGVLVLSEEFFTSQLSMLELVELVKFHMANPRSVKLIPIFLSQDLCNEVKCSQWISMWYDWAEIDERIHVEEWVEALQFVKSAKGLYKHAAHVFKFQEAIVEEICYAIPPFSRWDDSHVQGKSRLYKVIWKKIVCTSMPQTYKVQVVGLYGVGGIGKTTACKSLCNDLYKRFGKRICHIEFDETETPIKRLQEVLKNFTFTKHELLYNLTLDECWKQLENVVQSQRVFLAIDNVSSTSAVIEETKKYLEARYAHGSVLLVTTRSLDILKDLSLDDSNCLPMPELEATEARALFLHYGSAKTEVNEEIILRCLKRCYFSKGDGSSYHYHPLALKVLGSQLSTEDFEGWVSQMDEVDTFDQYREKENPIFSILRRSFDNLLPDDQLLFMDVVIFNSMTTNLHYHCQSNYSILNWLSLVHGISMGDVRMRLNRLMMKSLLEKPSDSSSIVSVHDLWREFATTETKTGNIESRRWVDERLAESAEDSCMADGGWENLQRISITTKANNDLDLSALKQLKSLELCFVLTSDCRSPRVRGIGSLTQLAVLVWLGISVNSLRAVEEISRLTNLEVLFLRCNVDKDVTPTTLALGWLSLLRRVKIEFSGGKFNISGLSADMTKLRILDLKGFSSFLRTVSGLNTLLGLVVLELHGGQDVEALSNLKNLKTLQVLRIRRCESLKELVGLGSLVGLQELRLTSCYHLVVLPDLSKLRKLQVLDLQNCASLRYIPGLVNLISLKEFIGRFNLLEDWPDLLTLSKLQKVHFSETWIELGQTSFWNNSETGKPFRNWSVNQTIHVVRVRQYELNNLVELGRLQELKISSRECNTVSGLSNLIQLKSLQLLECIELEKLPDMGMQMRLKSLKIFKCYGLKGWDGVGGLRSESQTGVDLHSDWILPHLEVLKWKDSPVIELPDLSKFPQLRVLKLQIKDPLTPSTSSDFVLHCRARHVHLEILRCTNWPIRSLPSLSKFPRLKQLKVKDCHRLMTLTCSGPLTALKTLHLASCTGLELLPHAALFPSLTDFTLKECGVKLTQGEAKGLYARCRPQFHVDDPSSLSLLTHMSSEGSSLSGPFFDNEDYDPIIYDDNNSDSESNPLGGFTFDSDTDRDSAVVAPNMPNDLHGGQSSLEVKPYTSEIVLCSEPNSELVVLQPPEQKA